MLKPVNENIFDRLRGEFLDDVRDRLGDLQQLIDCWHESNMDPAELTVRLRREAHALKGNGEVSGFPLISIAAHRLEDYLSQVPRLEPSGIADVQAHVDCMVRVLEEGRNPNDAEARTMLRALPVYTPFELGEISVIDVEILLVTGSRTIGRRVANELLGSGYRVVNCGDPFEALSLAARTRPDMVVASAVLPGLSGVDLVRALRAMTATADVKTAVLSSFSRDHSELTGLPVDTPIIGLRDGMSEDLADVLMEIAPM